MSLNTQPLSGASTTPLLKSSLNSSLTNVILDSDAGNSSFLFTTNGVNALYIDKYQNVGINTTSPSTQLEVASSNGACLRLRYGATSALADMSINSSGFLSLNPSGGELNTNASLNITAHDGSTVGLKLGGTLIAATAAQINTIAVSAGTAAASKALVLDSSRNITNINAITASQLTGTIQTANQPLITALGTISTLNVVDIVATGTFTLNGGNINDGLGFINGVIAGTASASKALVVDASINIAGINSIGTTSITIGGNTIGATQSGYITGITAGTASASKALVLNASSNISGINALSASTLTGAIQTANQSLITTLGTLTGLTVNGATSILSATDASSSTVGGALTVAGGMAVGLSMFIGSNLTIGGNLTVSGTTTTVNSTVVSIKDNTILLNAAPSGSFDSGILIQRYQTINNTASGDVVSDTAKETTTVSSATTLTIVLTAGNGANSYYNGWWVKVNSDVRLITNYVASTKTITVSTTFSSTPTNGQSVSLYNRSNAVLAWNEANKQFIASFTAIDSSTTLSVQDYANMKVGSLSATAPIQTADTTASSSVSTGSLVAAGGAGISGALYVGGGINGAIQTANQSLITTIGTLGSLAVSGSITVGGTAFSSTQAAYLSGITAGTATASKALVLDSSSNISGINALSASTLTGAIQTANQSLITTIGTLGSLAVSGSITVGGTAFSSTQAAYLSSITAGTAAASKALVLDASSNITGINSLSTTTLILGGNSLGATQSGYLTGITAGTASASKAVVLDSSSNIAAINQLSTTGLISNSISNATGSIVNYQTWTNSSGPLAIILGISNATMQFGSTGSFPISFITANTARITIAATGAVNIITGLQLAGSTVNATAAELNYNAGITVGTASASKSLVLDASSNITGINSLSTTTLILGGNSLGATQSGYLTGITAGTAAASKAMVLNASSNISSVNAMAFSTASLNTSYSITADNIILGAINKSYSAVDRFRGLTLSAITLTNSSTAASGTDATHQAYAFLGIPTVAATNASVTTTNASNLYIAGAPTAGTNMTITNAYSIYVAGGTVFFAGSLSMSGTIFTSTQAGYLSSITAGTATASKALVLDASSNITGINSLSTTTLILGGNSLGATQSGYLTGITAGTATASKALIFDASINISGINSLSTTNLTVGGSAVSGTTLAYLTGITAGTATASKALILDSSSNITGINSLGTTSITVGGNALGATESGYLTFITAGTASASKALVLNSSSNIAGINSISCTTLVLGGNSLGATQSGYITSLTAGTVSASKAMIVDSSSNIAGLNALAFGGFTLNTSYSITGNSVILGSGNKNYANTDQFRSITCSSITLTNTFSTVGATDASHQSYVFIGQPTVAATNTSITTTNASTVYITGPPIAGTNMTLTNTYAIYVANGSVFLASTLNMNGTIFSSTQAAYLTSITAGTASASKVLVTDVNTNISGINTLSTTTLTVGGNSIGATQSGYITGLTAGTASASKALVLDSSSNITGIASIGTTSITIGGNTITATQSSYLIGITAGTASASKALVLDSSSNITGINSLSTTTLILGGNSLGATQSGYLNGITAGTVSASKAMIVDSSSNIIGLNALTFSGYTLNTNYSINGNSAIFGSVNKNYTNADQFRAITCSSPTLTNTATAGSSTDATPHYYVHIGAPTLAATNASVTTTNATTLYIAGAPTNGTNMTITNAYAMYVNAGTVLMNSYCRLGVSTNGGVMIGTSTDNARLLSCLNGNMAVNATTYITFGQANSANNQVELSFKYVGNGSASNRFDIGFFGNGTRTMGIVPNAVGINIGDTSPRTALDFGANAANTIITMFQPSGGGSIYGFGANNSSTLYHSAAEHRWYSGTTSSSLGTNILALSSGGTLTTALNLFTNAGVRVLGQSTAGYTGSGLELEYVGGSGNIYAYNRSSAAYLTMTLNNAITITGSGNIGIGQLPSSWLMDVAYNTQSVTVYGYLNTGGFVGNSTGSTGSVNFSARFNGRIAVGTEVDVFSDIRVKSDIRDITETEACLFVDNMVPKYYIFKPDTHNEPAYGYIAQDLGALAQKNNSDIGLLVSPIPEPGLEELISDDGFVSPQDVLLTINYQKIVALLHVYILKQKQQINDNTDMIQQLKTEIEDLKKKLE